MLSLGYAALGLRVHPVTEPDLFAMSVCKWGARNIHMAMCMYPHLFLPFLSAMRGFLSAICGFF